MPRLRFETARDVFDAFPSAQERLRIEPNDQPSLQFLSVLAEQAADKAVGFCAYLLPRREAVWWACRSVKALSPPSNPDEQTALAAAEEWVKKPEEELRFAALKLGQAANHEAPTTWLALAAGWAGSTMPFEGKAVPVLADQTAKAVGAAILIAGSRCKPRQRIDLLKQCVRDGARLAAGEEQK
jgi:Family of unknown function (DUF6931)